MIFDFCGGEGDVENFLSGLKESYDKEGRVTEIQGWYVPCSSELDANQSK